LALPDSIRKLALRQAGLLPHPPKKRRHFSIDNRLVPLRRHEAELSTQEMLMRFKHIVLEAISASWDNAFAPDKSTVIALVGRNEAWWLWTNGKFLMNKNSGVA
jgi:hypothetical protein